jgi:hypothetical protein
MEHHAQEGRKRKVDDNCEQIRGLDSCSSSANVAGAWLTQEKGEMTGMEAYMGNLKRVDGETLKITTTDLVGTLEANALMLVGDGEGFRVLLRS